MTALTINGSIHYSEVQKRGGRWGWFETTNTSLISRFVAPGHANSKKDADLLRSEAIQNRRVK